MSKININKGIAPKSDQLNADDLLAGPRTIRLRDLSEGSAEQPWNISFDGDGGRPWKPSLTARRCLVAIWGDDPDRWIGLSLTIYCDDTVTWGGAVVGGIRISHMEGLSKPRTLMLTKTRGKKSGVTIQPLKLERKSGTDDWKARLYAVAEGGNSLTVDEAWAKVPAAVKEELGDALYDTLIALEQAAMEHIKNDPNAAVDALNASIL